MLRQNFNIRFGGPVTEYVKILMIVNGAVFILQKIFNFFYPGAVESIFGLSHAGLFFEFKIWQLFTYMFLHGSLLHILFNLLALWMFGGELEQLWGKKLFLRYYFFTGIGAGIFIAAMNFIVYSKFGYSPVTIGASGALYGILLAYGMTWPNREILLYFLFPIKVKYLVIAFGLIEFFGTISNVAGSGGTISHIGHIGGIISGFIFITYRKRKMRKPDREAPQAAKGNVVQFVTRDRLKQKQQEIETRIKAKKTIDMLLEKIAREGMASLTNKEKSNLEWARKHYYPNDDDTVH